MQKNKIHILSTGLVGKKLIEQAVINNINIEEVSFIKTEEVIDTDIKKRLKELFAQNITAVFTSVNAVTAISKFIIKNTSWKIFCIGNATKDLVEKVFGVNSVEGFADNAHHLSEQILTNNSIKKITFFCGDKRRDELPDNLKKNGIGIEEIIVYKTTETPVTLTREYDGILFFSPSGVKSFFSKNCISDTAKIFAIGTTTANEIKQFTRVPVIISLIPGRENLIKMVVNHFSKSNIF